MLQRGKEYYLIMTKFKLNFINWLYFYVNTIDIILRCFFYSESTTNKMGEFGWIDYTVFGALLVVSAGIGVGTCKDQSKSANQFLTAGGKMGCIPVALSMLARWSYIFILFNLLQL